MDQELGRVKEANHLFAQECNFVAGAATRDRLPDLALPEIAFAGRSNVGKSSLINALTNRKTLARISHTPGRTQQINFFSLGGRLLLVDLPGYGYAKISKKTIASWSDLINDYLKGRPNLRRICLLIDSRRGLKPTDLEIMKLLDAIAVCYQLILTKVDQCKMEETRKLVASIQATRGDHTAMHPDIILTSSREQVGIEELRMALFSFAEEKKVYQAE
jgi:GTP-binding protein